MTLQSKNRRQFLKTDFIRNMTNQTPKSYDLKIPRVKILHKKRVKYSIDKF